MRPFFDMMRASPTRRLSWILLALVLAGFAWLALRHRLARGVAAAADAAAVEPSAGSQLGLPDEPSSDATLPRATLAGKVTDPASKPIQGASVCAFARSERLVSAETRIPRCATSGADGRYRIEGLLVAGYEISATAPRYQPARWRNPTTDARTLELRTGETREGVDLVLLPGGVEVRGRVNDIAGGIVTGAVVTIGNEAVAETDIKGEWQAWVAPGEIQVHATATGYAEGSAEGMAPGQFIEVWLTPESVLEGRVVEAGTDTPVAGARVSAYPATALTDAEGHFRLSGLGPGRYKPEARSAHRWGIAAESVLLGVGESSSEVTIELHPAFTVSGRIGITDSKAPACSEGSLDLVEVTTGERRGAKPDQDGRVRIEGVLPGHYDVAITCPDAALEDTYPPITVAAEDVTGVTWTVQTGFTVQGKVVDATGQPVAGATVLAGTIGEGRDPRARVAWREMRTEKDGAFRLRGLPAATYRVQVDDHGTTPMKDPVEVKVHRNIDALRIVLPASGTIEGTVVDATGVPVPKLRVEAQGDRFDRRGDTLALDDGTFVLKGLPPGEYRLQATNRSWAVIRAPGTKDDDVQGVVVTVRARSSTRAKLVVEAQRGEIRGRVVDDGGQPVTDAFIEAARESDSAGKSAGDAERETRWGWDRESPPLTDLDGKFTVKKLSPGTYTVRAHRKGGGEAVTEHVQVGSHVTLTIRRAGSIAGTVSGARGRSPERFTVAVVDKKKAFVREESFFRTDGKFKLRDLPPGDFEVSAEASEGRALAQVPLAQGEKYDGLALTLEEGASLRGRVLSFDTGQPVAGMVVFVESAKGTNGRPMGMPDEGNRKNVTDTDGRFEIQHCPPGRVMLLAFPSDYAASEYGFAHVPLTLQSGMANEAPPLRVPRRRTKGLGRGGDLGFMTQEMPPDSDLEQTRFIVSAVRPHGPAAKAGLTVGDEIVSVEGQDVVGALGYLYHTLTETPEGASVTLGLRRGASIVIRAEKPL
ncbi:carboxypeptidase regulatory-like domain-containing protein [Pendulispora brunnea]|uniref:Carboxypeptidase regulatory-like domain-containing protein n=1 Tax=Pendulispora brunnea TaxID=2905690 RepID=A0ABZ2JVB2_9BACT